jgi:autotransporter-associated beta strand protein
MQPILFHRILTGFLLCAAAPAVWAQTVAFPGALGFGAYATGGRNGKVYHVTNTNDSGTGSFRDAVSSSGRTIVFDVGGTIKLASAVSCKGNLTIAGQTAPGGIKIDGGEVSFSSRANIICRYLRIRPGSDTSSTGDDCLGLYATTNAIFDHVSVAFGPYDNIDAVAGDSLTFQNCIDANPTGQQFGAHMENAGGHCSWHCNIFANSHNRNPLEKIFDTFINNVDYNCSAGYTTHTSTKFKHDIVNNYFVKGPAYGGSGDFPWYQVDKNQSIYYSGNYFDSNENSTLDGSITTPYWYQGTGTILSSPWSSWTAVIPTVSADLAWRYDVSAAGVFPRDEVDSLVISQVQTLGSGTTGYTAGTTGPDTSLYTSQAQTGLDNNGYGIITGLTAPVNYSSDGIADYWKLANNLSTNIAYPLTNTLTGYTLLENYLNFLAAPHAVTQTNTPVTINLAQFTAGFATSSTFSVTNATNGTVALQNGTNAVFTPSANFAGLGTFAFIVTDGSYSLCAQVVMCVTPATPPASAAAFNGALVTVATNTAAIVVATPNNLVWHGDGTTNAWNLSVSNWLDGGSASLFKNSDVVTFDDTGSASPAINLTTTVAPGGIYFNDNQNYTLSGVGALSGSGSFSKTGTGTLTIGTTNSSYTGSINISGGTLALNSGTSIGSGTVALSGGATLSMASGTAISIPGAISIPAGDNVTIASGYIANTWSGNLSGGDTSTVLNLKGNQGLGSTSSSQFSGFPGIINIPAGTSIRFSANSSGNTYGSTNPVFVINGTLQPRNGGNTVTLGMLSGSGALSGPQSSAGSGNTIYSIGGKNVDATFSGVINSNTALAGSLVCLYKVGTGTLTLTGTNTFTGTNGVYAGTLLLNGTNQPGLTIVFTNATLGGTGTLNGTVRVNSGGILSPGANGPGTLTINGHLTNNTPILNYTLSASPSGSNDLINLTGTLAMSGVQMFNFNLPDGTLGAGTYSLIEGATNSTASGVTLTNNLPGSTRQTFSMIRPTAGSNPSYVRLAVTGTAGALVWSGTNGSAWDLATTVNWLNAGNADVYYNLDTVVFNDAATNGGVAISGTVQPATLLVTNSATSFTFSNGAIAGLTSLVKAGSGALTLAASNAYTGGTLVSNGTLNVNNGYALGTGLVTLAGATLHFNSVGTGNAIAVSGTNTLQFSSQTANIYNSAALTGSGRLNLTIDGNDVFTPNGDWSGFSGYIYFTGGKWLRAFSQNVGSANAVWDLGSSTAGLYNQAGGYTVYLGALFGGSGTTLSGASTASVNTTTYQVGDLNTNCTFNGVITDNASPAALVKSGTATLTLTGASTFTGGTTVNSGTLCANSTTGSATGTGDLETFSGATLTGNGIIGSATTIDGGATLAPGNPSGTLTFTNSLTLNDSSLLVFGLGTNRDAVMVNGDLALTGQLTVTNAGGFGPGSYPLFTCGGALSYGNLTLVSAPAGYNYSFDTNTAGVVQLVAVLPPPPVIGSSGISAGKMVFSGSGGTAGATYYVVTSTNLAAPAANWKYILTNQFDADGNFALTNDPATNSQNFYRLLVP